MLRRTPRRRLVRTAVLGAAAAVVIAMVLTAAALAATNSASSGAVVKTRWGAQRPELFVPLTPREGAGGEPVPQFATLQKQALVRACAGEHLGAVGRVASEQPQTRLFPNGVRAVARIAVLGMKSIVSWFAERTGNDIGRRADARVAAG